MIDQQSALGIPQQVAYYFCNILLYLLQKLIHHFNGVRAHRERIRNGEEASGLVADLSHIVVHKPGVGMSVANGSHFVCWHQKFVPVDYLLKANVTLYYVDAHDAVFVENSPSVNIYNTRRYPFYFIAQRENAIKTVKVSISALIGLAHRIGDPKCDVGWVFHMARCGSTAVAQGLHAVPDCTVISESQDMLVHLSSLQKGVDFHDYVRSDRFYNILSSALIFILKDFKKGQLVCLKTTASLNYHLLPLIVRRFPNHKFVSMHRDGIGTAKSFYRMIGDHTGVRIGMLLTRLAPRLIVNLMKPILFIFSNGLLSDVIQYHYKRFDPFVMLYIQWVTNIVTFLRNTRHLEEGLVLPLYYEDVQIERRSVMVKVFKHFNIPTEHLTLALQAMEGDSQEGTPLALDYLSNNSSWVRDEQTVGICNQILEQYKLPSFDQRFRFNSKLEIELIN